MTLPTSSRTSFDVFIHVGRSFEDFQSGLDGGQLRVDFVVDAKHCKQAVAHVVVNTTTL